MQRLASPVAAHPRQRHSSPSLPSAPKFPALLGWSFVGLALLAAGLVVLRGCGYDAGIPVRYGVYFALEICLPGWVLLHFAGVRPLSPSVLIALGVPTGFAIEIFSFLALSSCDLRGLMPCLPLFWVALGLWSCRRRGGLKLGGSQAHVGVAAVLSALFLVTVLVAAGQMYSESPLVGGLPQRPIFHDWVYLLSRAAVIKHHWPLEDPSLAGTALQYHYFLLVHVAAASSTTGIEVTWVLLRLVVVPLGLVLIVQAYALGKLLARSRWAGVAATVLMLIPGELSYATEYEHGVFLGLFVRWLYVSPTFFFGVIFFGALLLALARTRWTLPQLVWIGGLAAAGTAAKGSVLPVLLVALASVALWSVLRDRRLPVQSIVIGCVLTASFGVVYLFTMAQWGSGEALFQPYRICQTTEFWNEHAIPWTRSLKRSLHAPDFGTWLGATLTGLAVVVGTSGVRLLAIPYMLRRRMGNRRHLARWLFATFVASKVLGLMLHFDGDSELYFLLLSRIPVAALAAGFLFAAYGRWRAWRQRIGNGAGPRVQQAVGWTICGATLAVLGLCLGLQIRNTLTCQSKGLKLWWQNGNESAVRAELLPLYEATAWIRRNTEPNAVLLTNAFTDRNLRQGRGVFVDHTTAGVYYYYSALTERRLWIEGPTYALDQTEARLRLRRSAQVFYRKLPPPKELSRSGPAYVLVDQGVGDGATFTSPTARRVFVNARFQIYKLAPASTLLAAQ